MKKNNVVCFGGGTGLAQLLRGLVQNLVFKVSAVVTMFDSGGSSGKLRDSQGILPPSDIFRCILASAPPEDRRTIRRIFVRRLAKGHTPGNLFMLGAGKEYDYQQAVDQLCVAFSARSKVYPVAIESSNLCAEMTGGVIAKNEVEVDKNIMEQGLDVERLYLNPTVSANPAVLEAIRKADVLCIGPGSFYTSLLPNLLPSGVLESITASKSPIVFIANLMTEGMGMAEYNLARYVEVLEKYIGRAVDRVIVNRGVSKKVLEKYMRKEHKKQVKADGSLAGNLLVEWKLWGRGSTIRHDATALAYILGAQIYELLQSKK